MAMNLEQQLKQKIRVPEYDILDESFRVVWSHPEVVTLSLPAVRRLWLKVEVSSSIDISRARSFQVW